MTVIEAAASFAFCANPEAVTTISSSSVSASVDCVEVSAKTGVANAAKMATDKVEWKKRVRMMIYPLINWQETKNPTL